MEKLNFDGLLTICTGSSRKTKIWKKKEILWSDLINRLSQTTRTYETQADYFKFKKARQDEIKDVGGFVGGELKDGKRTALTILNRTVITLDADFAESNLWAKVKEIFNGAICVYSTHKHTPEHPRLRLVIPINRPVLPDEYQAISRRIAESFGIDNFDDTTYQPHRLMYFPSTSSDAEFFFKTQDGEFLNADKILAEYDDWQDASTWAHSSRTTETVNRELTKAEDPLSKKGIIGAFCRAYNIQETINKFLSDVYEECGENRYTFKAGSSFGGAVVYEDKWLYSFHATDPCSLQLCNAFDLVRIHKFGNLDDGKDKTDITKLPSFNKALEFCSKDSQTISVATQERYQEVQEDFDPVNNIDDNTEDMSWQSHLQINAKTGKILPTRKNIRTILENDPRIKNHFGYDLFTQRIAVTQPLFWRNKKETATYWTDSDDAQLRYYLETYFDINCSNKIDDELLSIAHKNAFHKVCEYLEGLQWDGVNRLDFVFIDYLGAVNNKYVRTITRKTLLAAVARVMSPGFKWDNMLVLEGPQGIGKSELLSKLGKEWFSDSLNEMQGKDAYEALRGYWILEISELAAMKKSETSAVKKFISKKVDSFRVSYGRRTQDFPRQCIFFGTTNEKIFLKDPTGNRRFLTISVGLYEPKKAIFDNPDINYEIDQIWAEAYALWKSGEEIWIGKEMEEIAKKIQDQHTEENPLVGMIEEYLNKIIPVDWYNRSRLSRVTYMTNNGDFDNTEEVEKIQRDKICTLEIWCELMSGDVKRFSPYSSKEIVTALNCLVDWEPYKKNGEKLFFGVDYGWQKAFVRKHFDDAISDDDIFD